jgi:hypothetical protein
MPLSRSALGLFALALGLVASACNDGNVLGSSDDASGSGGTGGKAGASGSGGKTGTGGSQNTGSGGDKGSSGSGGAGKGSSNAGSGGMGAGGAGGSGAGGSGIDAGSDVIDSGPEDAGRDTGVAPLPDFTLVVDAPSDDDSVGNPVTVTGRAPGFLNVEVWDATHQMPPLGQDTPDADGAFSISVDTSGLTAGATTWTVYAWDSAPGEAFDHTANTVLDLTIEP